MELVCWFAERTHLLYPRKCFHSRKSSPQPGSWDPTLQPNDEIYAFQHDVSRAEILSDVVGRLKNDATLDGLPKTVNLRGAVRLVLILAGES